MPGPPGARTSPMGRAAGVALCTSSLGEYDDLEGGMGQDPGPRLALGLWLSDTVCPPPRAEKVAPRAGGAPGCLALGPGGLRGLFLLGGGARTCW